MTAAAGGGTRRERPAAAPGDRQALAREIEQTREDLGETVAALVARADVKARARERAHELSARVAGKAGRAGERVVGQAGHLRRSAGPAGRAQLPGQAGQGRTLLGAARTAGRRAAPVPQRAAAAARQRPAVPAVVAAGLLMVGILAAVRRRRRCARTD